MELCGLIYGKISTKKTGRLFWAADEEPKGLGYIGLDIERVDVDDGEHVVGNREEELIVQCGVDEPWRS